MGKVVGSYSSFQGNRWENWGSLGGKEDLQKIDFQVGVQQLNSGIWGRSVIHQGSIHAEHQHKWVKHVQGLVGVE